MRQHLILRSSQKNTWRKRVMQCMILLGHLYCFGVCVWFFLHSLFGDRWWWLFLLNALAVYMFLPLPVLALIAVLTRQQRLWIGIGATVVIGLYLYGGYLLPTRAAHSTPESSLTVMTYNVGVRAPYHKLPLAHIADTVRAANPDVVAFQESGEPIIAMLQHELMLEYPYQMLDSQPFYTGAGMAVISRYPLYESTEALEGRYWFGTPQVLVLDFHGRSVMLINFHAAAVHFRWKFEQNRDLREQQARALALFASQHPDCPLLALGDLNSTPLNTAYRIVTTPLNDAWREAGWGTGCSFPAPIPGKPWVRLKTLPVPVPAPLVRVDYILYSDHWYPVEVRKGPLNKATDHLSVVARFTLT